ncbi:hypothetical protein [Streptomyces sp. NPDC047042]|uniref:hypothetical protein n=1 Tax=Streptomyces sp. NPDC047042 TaxID=3154807 RepID=UPI00340A60EF
MKTYSNVLQPVRSAMWHTRAARYLAQNSSERQAIAPNEELRGRHRGERCFILGNGPSLLSEDLSLVAGERVFTVNNLLASEVGAPSPHYHVISDRRFFSMDSERPSDRAMTDRLVSITCGGAEAGAQLPTTFAPSSEMGRLESFAAGRAHDVRYFCNPYYFSDYYHVSADLTRVIPRFSSVIQHAIVIAVYLGFKEIYLLGCDTTNIVANVQTALEESVATSYAYEVSTEVDRWLRDQYLKRDMERCAESFLEVLVAFRFVADFCDHRGVKLVNCSSRTVIDSITRSNLRDVV